MKIENIPFMVTDWEKIAATKHNGVTGYATWKTLAVGNVRVRIVDYTPGYLADHWCSKGHVLYVLDGELTTELQDGRKFQMTKGMSYEVADNAELHRSSTKLGAKLFIVD